MSKAKTDAPQGASDAPATEATTPTPTLAPDPASPIPGSVETRPDAAPPADPSSPIPGSVEQRPDAAPPADPAEQLADLVADGLISHLRVRALTDGFRRGGRAWTTQEQTVVADNFSREQILALVREPMLVVTPEARAFNE